MRTFHVRLPDFESAGVLGLWVWRQAASGQFERFAQIQFGTIFEDAGIEVLPYTVTIDGSPFTLNTLVERDPAAPEDVLLYLSFGNAVGTFKLSSYNASGESSLSEGTVVF